MAKDKYLVGRTMAGEAPRVRREELARLALKKKRQRRKAVVVLLVLAVVAVFVVVAMRYVLEFVAERRALEAAEQMAEPTVEIIDENAGENISLRVKVFVARLETDVRALHYRVERVVLPYQMARQVNVYIEGREEYYKLSIDRGSAEQAEDMVRMAEYLEEKGISCGYVDLRVEGKAFYK